jgi:hypothetical protein
VGEGRVLTPANANPWYVLMTLYGEQDGEWVDWELHKKNRAAWNAWSCQAMGDEERAEAAESSGVTVDELSAWPTLRVEISQQHKAEMLRRNGPSFVYPGIEDIGRTIDLHGVLFEHHVVMNRTVFGNNAQFSSTTFARTSTFFFAYFGGHAWFEGATFKSHAWFGSQRVCGVALFGSTTFMAEALFYSAVFSGDASFSYSYFSGNTSFQLAKFDQDAHFRSAKFDLNTIFDSVTFSKLAEFDRVNTKGAAWFDSATFHGFAHFAEAEFGTLGQKLTAGFTDCLFEKSTNFGGAIFHSRYPDFTGSVLHEKTCFTDHLDNWPKQVSKDTDQIEAAKAACAAIRHNLGKQGLPEAEHFFFRREMGFAGQIGGWWQRLPYRAFGAVSDYGYAIDRPALWLFWVWFLPVFAFAAARVTGTVWTDIFEVLWAGALSFANLFPVFGFHRVWFDPEKLANLSPWLKALAGAQTVVSLPLLFFLGLGLRTRFRMR